MEPISPGDLVGQSRRVRMILVGVDLDVEGVGDDLTVLGQAVADQT